jgi:hypothetical protein
VWATQFHPEKSGTAGLALLNNFVSFIDDVASTTAARNGGTTVARSDS